MNCFLKHAIQVLVSIKTSLLPKGFFSFSLSFEFLVFQGFPIEGKRSFAFHGEELLDLGFVSVQRLFLFLSQSTYYAAFSISFASYSGNIIIAG